VISKGKTPFISLTYCMTENSIKSEKTDISELFNVGLCNLLKLDYSFSISDIEKQRLIIRTLFPEQMHVENGLLRTGRVKEAAQYIYLINNNLSPKKNGQIIKKMTCPISVIPLGFEPKTYRLEICCSIQLSYGTMRYFAVQICKNPLKN
jgi:hypothetical protein